MTGFPLKWRKQISGLFSTINTRKIRPTVLPLTTFYVVLIRKHGSENVTWNIFCWFIIIINVGKLNCKNFSITDFFSTSVQFQILKNSNSNFRTPGNPAVMSLPPESVGGWRKEVQYPLQHCLATGHWTRDLLTASPKPQPLHHHATHNQHNNLSNKHCPGYFYY